MSIPKYEGPKFEGSKFTHISTEDIDTALSWLAPETLMDGTENLTDRAKIVKQIIANIAKTVISKLHVLFSLVSGGNWLTEKTIMNRISYNIQDLTEAIKRHPDQEEKNHLELKNAIDDMQGLCMIFRKVGVNNKAVATLQSELNDLEKTVLNSEKEREKETLTLVVKKPQIEEVLLVPEIVEDVSNLLMEVRELPKWQRGGPVDELIEQEKLKFREMAKRDLSVVKQLDGLIDVFERMGAKVMQELVTRKIVRDVKGQYIVPKKLQNLITKLFQDHKLLKKAQEQQKLQLSEKSMIHEKPKPLKEKETTGKADIQGAKARGKLRAEIPRHLEQKRFAELAKTESESRRELKAGPDEKSQVDDDVIMEIEENVNFDDEGDVIMEIEDIVNFDDEGDVIMEIEDIVDLEKDVKEKIDEVEVDASTKSGVDAIGQSFLETSVESRVEKIRREMSEKIDAFIEQEITRRKNDLEDLKTDFPYVNFKKIVKRLDQIVVSLLKLKSTYSVTEWFFFSIEKEVSKLSLSDCANYQKVVESEIQTEKLKLQRDRLGIDKAVEAYKGFKKTAEALLQEAEGYGVEKAVHAHALIEAIKKGEKALHAIFRNSTTLAAISEKIPKETAKLETTFAEIQNRPAFVDLLGQLEELPPGSHMLKTVKKAFISEVKEEMKIRREKMREEYDDLELAIAESGFTMSYFSFDTFLSKLNEILDEFKEKFRRDSNKNELLETNQYIMKALSRYDDFIVSLRNQLNDIENNSEKLEQIDSKIDELKEQNPPQIIYYRELENLKNEGKINQPIYGAQISEFDAYFKEQIEKFDAIMNQEPLSLMTQLQMTEKSQELTIEKELIQAELVRNFENFNLAYKKKLSNFKDQFNMDIFHVSFKNKVNHAVDKLEKSIIPREEEEASISTGMWGIITKPFKNLTSTEWLTYMEQIQKKIKNGEKSISEYLNSMELMKRSQNNFIDKSIEMDKKINEYREKGHLVLCRELEEASKQHGEIVQKALTDKGSIRNVKDFSNLCDKIANSARALSIALAEAQEKE